MFCPEDGALIPYDQRNDFGTAVYYEPCIDCGQCYVYDATNGTYEAITEERYKAMTARKDDPQESP